MRAIVSLAALAGVLVSCSMSRHNLNFVTPTPEPDARAMAADAIGELVKLYPPAQTRLAVEATDDPFGSSLVTGLRERGYAVEELPHKRGKGETFSGLPLAYTVDRPLSTGFYRVTLRVASQSMTRGYTVEGSGLAPSTAWALDLTGAPAALVERSTRPDLPTDAAAPVSATSDVAPIATADPATGIVTVPLADPTSGIVDANAPVPTQAGIVEAYQMADRQAAIVGAHQSIDGQADQLRRYQRTGRPGRHGIGARRVSASPHPRGWRIQFAAFRNPRYARVVWHSMVARQPALASYTPLFPRSTHGLTFVQAGIFRTVDTARQACAGLKAGACVVVKS